MPRIPLRSIHLHQVTHWSLAFYKAQTIANLSWYAQSLRLEKNTWALYLYISIYIYIYLSIYLYIYLYIDMYVSIYIYFFSPKQVYLYGVLTPFKGLHPWAAVSELASRPGCLGPHEFTLFSYTCFPHLSPTLGALGRMSLHLSPTLVSHSGCLGPHEFTLVSHTCLLLWVPWAA